MILPYISQNFRVCHRQLATRRRQHDIVGRIRCWVRYVADSAIKDSMRSAAFIAFLWRSWSDTAVYLPVSFSCKLVRATRRQARYARLEGCSWSSAANVRNPAEQAHRKSVPASCACPEPPASSNIWASPIHRPRWTSVQCPRRIPWQFFVCCLITVPISAPLCQGREIADSAPVANAYFLLVVGWSWGYSG